MLQDYKKYSYPILPHLSRLAGVKIDFLIRSTFSGFSLRHCLCQKCFRYDKKHYKPKPEVKEWIDWMLTDQSWEQWRKENPEKVERMRKSILTPASRDR